MSKIDLQPGDVAPAFDLPSTTGRVSLEKLRGRKVVVYFYPKDDTPGCTTEAIDFSRLREDFAKARTEILGVSPDPVKSHEKFRQKHDLAISLASDESRTMLESFGVWVEKSMYGRQYMGVERSTFLIDGAGKIAQIWRKVKVAGHAEAVLEAARKL